MPEHHVTQPRQASQLHLSVIVPVYNGRRFLARLLDHVFVEAHAAVGNAFEVIVVDDGSTDGSSAYLERQAGIIFIKQGNAGVANARNVGLAHAQGDTIAFLDMDDLWIPGTLGTRYRVLHEHDLGFVTGWVDEVDDATEALVRTYRGFFWALGAALFRRDAISAVNGLDETVDVADDVDLMLKLLQHGTPAAVLETVTLLFRQHESNTSKQFERTRHAQVRSFMRAHQRWRNGALKIPDLTTIPRLRVDTIEEVQP